MTQKLKVIISVLVIIVVVVIGIVVVRKVRVKSQSAAVNHSQDQQNPNMQAPSPEKPKAPEAVKVITVRGTVSAIATDSIEVTNGQVKNTFPLTQDISVVFVDGANMQKKALTDIKKGDTVSLMINSANSSVLSIQDGKDAGSAA